MASVLAKFLLAVQNDPARLLVADPLVIPVIQTVIDAEDNVSSARDSVLIVPLYSPAQSLSFRYSVPPVGFRE